jgi:hypothetical protein
MESTLFLHYNKFISDVRAKISVGLENHTKHSKYTVCDNAEF